MSAQARLHLGRTFGIPDVLADADPYGHVVQTKDPILFSCPKGTILVVSAGTSDMPVAEEAAVTAEVMGNHVERLCDVGVAGIHRLLAHRAELQAASVIIVVAGMEGA